MKRIYNKDIKAMKLTEDEMWWAKDTIIVFTTNYSSIFYKQ